MLAVIKQSSPSATSTPVVAGAGWRSTPPRVGYSRFDGGKVVRADGLTWTRTEALEAAGLSGVGDVGGERGDRPASPRGLERRESGRLVGRA